MGVAERRIREKERRRNEIIDAAEKVFFKKGARNATMSDVASKAELSKGTLYLYFKSKEDLYLAINARGQKILHKMFHKAVSSAQTGFEKIFSIGHAYFDFSRMYPDYFECMIYYETKEIDMNKKSIAAQECVRYGSGAMETTIDAIRIGIEDGSIRPDLDPTKTALILWAQSTGIIQINYRKGVLLKLKHNINREEMINTYFDLIKYTIMNKDKIDAI